MSALQPLSGGKRTHCGHVPTAVFDPLGHFLLTPKSLHRQDPRMGGRSEPETARTPLRDMPMRQGEIGGSRRPILTASCYCASCQEAGSRFEQLPSAPPVLNPDGGTDYVLYRKDRVQCVTGQEYLEEHRLKPDSPTRRVIAICCNSGMFLDFTKGHWLTMYRNRFPADAPPLEMRVMTQDRRDGVELADDLPNYDGHSGRFMLRLIAAWIAMGLRRPENTLGKTVRKSQ